MDRFRGTQNQDHWPSPLETTADYLAMAVIIDLFPEDRQTCKDYGFDRAITFQDKSNLLGLYGVLIKFMDIPPKTIHDWRVRGVLVDEIKAAHCGSPYSKGPYFRWFLQNQHVIALAGQPLSIEETLNHSDAMVGQLAFTLLAIGAFVVLLVPLVYLIFIFYFFKFLFFLFKSVVVPIMELSLFVGLYVLI